MSVAPETPSPGSFHSPPDPQGMLAMIRAQVQDRLLREESAASMVSPTLVPSTTHGLGPRSRDEYESEDIFQANESQGPTSRALVIGSSFTLERGQALKKHKNLSAESETDADKFLKSANPIEHAFMAYLASLECRDLLKMIARENLRKYTLSETLKKTIQDYAQVAILSPSLFAYRSAGLPAMILQTMRELNVAELPPTSETGRCDLVIGTISKALIDWRCHVKAQLVKSFAENENKWDIATLTRACIGTSKAKPTAALYMRISFLRNHLKLQMDKKAEKKGDERFWLSVDKELANWRLEFTSSAMLQCALEEIYNNDKALYGEPDGSQSVTATKDLDEWLQVVNSNSRSAPTAHE